MTNDDNTLRITGQQPGDGLRMLKTPDAWPLGAVLPLIRRSDPGLPEEGLVFCLPGLDRTTVFKVNLFEIPTSGTTMELIEALRDVETLRYGSFEEMLEAGWIVN
jgi:hypothetical protein